MMPRIYRAILAGKRGGLRNAAPASDGWTILENTIRDFSEADSEQDGTLGDIGGFVVKQSGVIALAYKEV
jgi:hypothetical protein